MLLGGELAAQVAPEVVIRARALHKIYPVKNGFPGWIHEVQAVADICFALHRGETLGVIGDR